MTLSTTTFAIAIGLMASGAFNAVQAQEPVQQPQRLEHSQPAGEDVANDLADWRQAGFDTHSYDVLSYDVFGAEYQRRYAKYQALKRLRAQAAVQE